MANIDQNALKFANQQASAARMNVNNFLMSNNTQQANIPSATGVAAGGPLPGNQGIASQQQNNTSMSQLPSWAIQNIGAFNMGSNVGATGQALNRQGIQAYNNAYNQYGGMGEWTPFAFAGKSVGGAGLDPTQANVLLGSGNIAAGKKLTGLEGNLFGAQDIMRNAFTGGVTGYGDRQNYSFQSPDMTQKDWDTFWSGKGTELGGIKYIDPTKIDAYLNQSLNPFIQQYRDLLSDPLSEGPGISADALTQLKKNILQREAPNTYEWGLDPNAKLGAYGSGWQQTMKMYDPTGNYNYLNEMKRKPTQYGTFG
jgi:hypothetical protein